MSCVWLVEAVKLIPQVPNATQAYRKYFRSESIPFGSHKLFWSCRIQKLGRTFECVACLVRVGLVLHACTARASQPARDENGNLR